jgi:hypothetical protein
LPGKASLPAAIFFSNTLMTPGDPQVLGGHGLSIPGDIIFADPHLSPRLVRLPPGLWHCEVFGFAAARRMTGQPRRKPAVLKEVPLFHGRD